MPKFSADELGRKMAEGASFYTQGTKLLVQDVQYGIKLILKAIVGETLQPREVQPIPRRAAWLSSTGR